MDLEKWSGRLDSNQRPPAPKAGALPGCATPRLRLSLASPRREPRRRRPIGLICGNPSRDICHTFVGLAASAGFAASRMCSHISSPTLREPRYWMPNWRSSSAFHPDERGVTRPERPGVARSVPSQLCRVYAKVLAEDFWILKKVLLIGMSYPRRPVLQPDTKPRTAPFVDDGRRDFVTALQRGNFLFRAAGLLNHQFTHDVTLFVPVNRSNAGSILRRCGERACRGSVRSRAAATRDDVRQIENPDETLGSFREILPVTLRLRVGAADEEE